MPSPAPRAPPERGRRGGGVARWRRVVLGAAVVAVALVVVLVAAVSATTVWRARAAQSGANSAPVLLARRWSLRTAAAAAGGGGAAPSRRSTLSRQAVLRQPGVIAAALSAVGKRTLTVGVHALWLEDGRAVLGELAILMTALRDALGLPVQVTNDVESADVVVVGPYGVHADTVAWCAARRATTFLVWVAPENTDGTPYADQMVHVVHASLGLQHRTPHPLTNYLRLPWWLPYATDASQTCAFAPALLAESRANPAAAAAAWAARPRFAVLLSRHYGAPRPALFHMMNASGFGRVDAPSVAFHNMEWPARLPNSHLAGKVEFLADYRYNIAPENSRTRGGGYNTEKAPQALMAGAIPVYWGDSPLDPVVFNPRRIITYQDGDNASVLDVVAALETQEAARVEWFSEPVLAPTARAWLATWCRDVRALLRDTFAAFLAAEAWAPDAAVG